MKKNNFDPYVYLFQQQLETTLDLVKRSGKQHELVSSPRADPLEGQRLIFQRALELSKCAGLRLPRHVRCCWRLAPDGASDGTAHLAPDGQGLVFLNVSQAPLTLAETCFHELAHLHDFKSGQRFSLTELEMRAIRFANSMMRAWPC